MNPAYAYVYDEVLSQPRHERFLGEIETEAQRAGVEGRILRVGMFRDARESLKELKEVGVKNIIFVGSDQSLLNHIALLPSLEMTVGLIPMAKDSYLAAAFRLPIGVKAIQAIAGRLIDCLDLGKIGERIFLTEVVIPDTDAAVEVNNEYRLSPRERGGISIRNLSTRTGEIGCFSDPQDGVLEVVIQNRSKPKSLFGWKNEEVSETRLYLKEGVLVAKTAIDAFVDGQKITHTRFPFSVLPKAIRVITGREGLVTRRG